MADFVEQVNRETELALAEKVTESIVGGLENAGCQLYTSFNPTTREEKAKLVNATGDGLSLMEHLGKDIALVDVVVMPVEVDGETGRQICPRISLISADGAVYTCVSWGAYKSLQKINAIYGELHFDPDDPLVIRADRVKTKKGQTFNIKVVG